jgi:tetratricopeptide (TPR) repeat protein
VHELGRLPDGRPYFIMKLIQGDSLHQLLKDRASRDQDLPRFVSIFEQVCQTLAYAHARGVIHRDLKPNNIMVGAFGEVQVMDWGLAKLLESTDEENPPSAAREESPPVFGFPDTPATTGETAAGAVLGTPAYMAPEQARGEIGSLDARTDVFGLGAILCHLLTGQPPFAGSRVLEQARAADLTDAHARLERCEADVMLVQLARQCLAADRQERPPDGGAVAQAVAQYQQQLQQRLRQAELEGAAARARVEEEQKRREVEQARAQEERQRRQAERQKRRVQLVLAGVVLLTAVAGGGLALWYQQHQAARATRHELREQGIREALQQTQQVRATLHQHLSEPGGIFALLNRPADWSQQLAASRAALRRAQDKDEEAEFPVADQLRQEIRELASLIQQDEADRQLALALENVRLDRATVVDGQFNTARAVQSYRQVFHSAGLAVAEPEIMATAARIKRSPIREQLLAALDDWAQSALLTKQEVLADRLLALARRCDPDAERSAVHDLQLWRNGPALEKLAARLKQGLAAEQGGRRLSPQMYRLLGALLAPHGREGEAWLRQGQTLYPADFWLNLAVGNILASSRPEAAAGFYRGAVAVRPHSSAAHINLGNVLRMQGDLSGAMAAYRRALTLNAKSALAYSNMAIALKLQGDLPGAIAAYRQALAIDPKLAPAHYNLGLALQAQRNLPGAIAAFRQSVAIDPNFAPAHTDLGNALQAQRDLPGAIAEFRRALAIDPKYVPAHNNLGTALRDQNNLPGAIAAFRQAVALDPRLAQGHWNLALALQAQGDLPGAVAAYRQTLALDPKNAAAHNNLGLALKSLGNLPGAITAYRQALAINPKLVEAYYNLGDALKILGDRPGAIAAFRQAGTLAPKLAMAHNNLASTLHELQDVPGAIAAYRRALAADPRLVQAHGGLGLALLAQGEFAAAAQATQQCLQLLPPGHPLRGPVQHQLQQCQHAIQLEKRAQAILQGQAAGAVEQLQLAQFCRQFKQYQAAARLYAAALAAQPALAGEPTKGQRYHAACTAALAAAGQDLDATKLPQKNRIELRRQALDWLRADLERLAQTVADHQTPSVAQKPPAASPLEKLVSQSQKPSAAALLLVCDRLQQWQQTPDLTSVRDDKELARLSREEQKAWRNLWEEVRSLHQQARACFTEHRLSGSLTAGQKEQRHESLLRAGQTYIFELESTAFDPFLRLEDAKGKQLAENDDIEPGVNKNSRIIVIPKESGTYRLVATAFQGRGTGAYTLVIREFVRGK